MGGYRLVRSSMKAILEFTYPDDEERLRWALHGGTAICGLDTIRSKIRAWEKCDGQAPEELIERIKMIVSRTLTECGEE